MLKKHVAPISAKGMGWRVPLAWISVALTMIAGFQVPARVIAEESTTGVGAEEELTVVVDLVPLFDLFPPVFTETVGSNGSIVRQVAASSYDQALGYLAANGLSIWEPYESYVLANASQVELRWLHSHGVWFFTVDNRTTVGRGAYYFDTRDGEPSIPEDLRAQSDPSSDYVMVIIQFIGPVKEVWTDMLRELGILPVEYLANFAFLVKSPVASISRVSSWRHVQWVGAYHPAYKLSPWLSVGDPYAAQRVVVDTLSEDPAALWVQLEGVGFRIVASYGDAARVLFEAIGDRSSILAASRIPSLLWVEPLGSGSPGNDQAVWVIQSNVMDVTPVHDHGIRGEGSIITIMDTGISAGHEMFADPENDPPGPFHRKVAGISGFDDGDSGPNSGHGTHVAGSIVGDAPAYLVHNLYDGMAFEGRIFIQDIQSWICFCMPTDPRPWYQEALDTTGSTIHSNSWGRDDNPGLYTQYDNYIDTFTWQNPRFLVIHIAGNEGGAPQTIREEASAKNLLIVGASGNGASSNNLFAFSGRGPTRDGRLKPTVLAPGQIISASSPPSAGCTVLANPAYQECFGTSHAAPLVAGAAAMVREYFIRGFYPTGQAVGANTFEPSAALIRATLVNGAVEITGLNAYQNGQTYPNNDQGWGRIHLDNSLYLSGDSRRLFVIDETKGLSNSDYVEYEFQVSGGVPFEATLAWTDYPGASGCTFTCLVDDLDIVVTDPSGNQYLGNVFAGTPGQFQSTTGGVADRKNVEEGVLRLTPDAGTWRVRVNGYNVPFGPQPFALVVTGVLSDPTNVQVSTWVDHSAGAASFVDSSDRTHLVWHDQHDSSWSGSGDYDIFYARLSAAGNVEIRRPLAGDATLDDVNPSIAFDLSTNEIWVAWEHRASSSGELAGGVRYTKSADFGNTWQGGYDVAVGSSSASYRHPSLTIDINGRKHLVARYWSLETVPNPDQDWERVQYLWTSATNPTSPSDWTSVAISPTYTRTHTTCSSNPMVYDPNVVTGGNIRGRWDDLHIVFGHDPPPECGTGGTTYVRYIRSLDRGSSWDPEKQLASTIDYARPNAVEASAANIFVAFHDWKGSTAFDILYTRSTNAGTSWTAPTPILQTSAWEISPSLSYAVANGVLALAWSSGSAPPANYEVHVRKSTDSGSTWSTPVPITGDPARSDYPVVRLDSLGAYYLIAWADARRNSDAWYDVYYRKLAV